jgi:ABC-type multidrug transport system ATPase subunit
MNVMSNSLESGTISGHILFNGKSMQNNNFVAMVPEKDLHMLELTVYENLYFSSQLRVGRGGRILSISSEEDGPPDIIKRVAQSLGIDHLLDTVVGKGLSPGELRLLTIATEMLDLPVVLVFDNPTVGRSFAALYLITLIYV